MTVIQTTEKEKITPTEGNPVPKLRSFHIRCKLPPSN